MRPAVFLAVLLVPFSALPGDLTVRVLDPQEAVIPGARIELTRTDASWTASSVVDGSGSHRFESLPPGAYLATASATGFASRVEPVRIEDGGPLELDIRLELAAVSESVVVTGADRAERRSDSTKTMSVVGSDEMAK
ncbi:MAG TPA: carboxypeptidase-like regulatory domain-containing protein, partial [Vicinamibacteria bacterium]